MNSNELLQLLKHYQEGTLSSEGKKWIDEWIDKYGENFSYNEFSDADKNHLKEMIIHKIDHPVQTRKTNKLPVRVLEQLMKITISILPPKQKSNT